MCVENSKYKKIMLIDKSEKRHFHGQICASVHSVWGLMILIFFIVLKFLIQTLIDIHRSSL